MVLNNVTKFHKILIKSIRLRERTSFGQTYGWTGVTLNAPAIVMGGINEGKSRKNYKSRGGIKVQSILHS